MLGFLCCDSKHCFALFLSTNKIAACVSSTNFVQLLWTAGDSCSFWAHSFVVSSLRQLAAQSGGGVAVVAAPFARRWWHACGPVLCCWRAASMQLRAYAVLGARILAALNLSMCAYSRACLRRCQTALRVGLSMRPSARTWYRRMQMDM
jgi:hypothetical protein